jgi:CRISPR system Cascade subunit CasB
MSTLERAADLVSGLPNRDHAQLRRPGITPALWKVLANLGKSESDYFSPYEWEKRWKVLLRGIALVGQGNRDFGEALAEAGWSEGRLLRLLEAEGESLYDQIRFATTYLESKEVTPDWKQCHDLLFYDNERARHAIARSYYRVKAGEESE